MVASILSLDDCGSFMDHRLEMVVFRRGIIWQSDLSMSSNWSFSNRSLETTNIQQLAVSFNNTRQTLMIRVIIFAWIYSGHSVHQTGAWWQLQKMHHATRESVIHALKDISADHVHYIYLKNKIGMNYISLY